MLMNVRREATIVMKTLHVQIRQVHFPVSVMLVTQEVGPIAKVSGK